MISKMSKLTTFILGIFAGLIIGGGLIFYFIFGVPTSLPPGNLISPPDASGNPPGTASISLNQQFFDTVLTTIFNDMNAPSFPLAQNPNDLTETPMQIQFQNSSCDGKVVLLPSGSSVKTSVRLENGKISAPLAFRGSYSLLGFCYQFTGWANANLKLRFDETQQTVFGQIEIESVNLDGIPAMASGVISRYVQSALNSRVNPIVILKTSQIALNVPVAATDGTLSAKVKEVRAEIKENALNLYVIYNFSGTKGRTNSSTL